MSREPDSWVASVDRAGSLAADGAVTIAEEGSCRVVFDGDLYVDGQIINGDAGAHVVLDAYHRHGESFPRALRGRFASVLADTRDRTVLATRDPMGLWPLFYAPQGDRWIFSPAGARLVDEIGAQATPDPVALAARLLDLALPDEQTTWRSVLRVNRGHVLRISRGVSSTSRYWRPENEVGSMEGAEHAVLEQFLERLEVATRRCLSHGRAGVFLSGGLDSATVAATARRCAAYPPLALSLEYPHPTVNERAMQDAVATALSLPHFVLQFDDAVGSRGLLASGIEATHGWWEPPQSPWWPAYEALARSGMERGCRVILSGEGGDEWLMPSLVQAGDALRTLDVAQIVRLMRAWRGHAPLSPSAIARLVLWSNGGRPLLRGALGRVVGVHPATLRSVRERRLDRALPEWLLPDEDLRKELVARVVDTSRAPSLRHLDRDAKRRRLVSTSIGAVLEEAFEGGRRLNLTFLQPLLDADLVAFLLSTPPQILVWNGEAKWLARASLERQLSTVRAWPRAAYANAFFNSVVEAEAPGIWRSLGGVEALAQIGVVEPERLASWVQAVFEAPGYSASRRLWDIFVLETWLRREL